MTDSSSNAIKDELLNFIESVPTAFHFCNYFKELLVKNGFVQLSENDMKENVVKGFVIRDCRTICAWNGINCRGANIAFSHSDSPCLMVKPTIQTSEEAKNNIIRCSSYGGGLWCTWFGRDLKLAGKIYARINGVIETILYDSKRPIAFMPPPDVTTPSDTENELKVHTCDFRKYERGLLGFIEHELNIPNGSIECFDLRFFDSMKPNVFNDILTTQRHDNLVNTFAGLYGFIHSNPARDRCNIFCAFDNEEIGSSTHVGYGNVLTNVINYVTTKGYVVPFKHNSLMISLDSNHARHPKFQSQTSSSYSNFLGSGVSLSIDYSKASSSSLYTTAYLQFLCQNSKTFQLSKARELNSSSSGSTLGPCVEAVTGIKTADCGCMALAMHSIREIACFRDTVECVNLCRCFYSSYPNS